MPLARSFLGVAALAILRLLLSAIPGRQTPLWRASAFVTLGSRCSCLIPLCHSARLGGNFESALSWKPWCDRKGRLGRYVPSQRVVRVRQGLAPYPPQHGRRPNSLCPLSRPASGPLPCAQSRSRQALVASPLRPTTPLRDIHLSPRTGLLGVRLSPRSRATCFSRLTVLPPLRFVVMEPGFLPVHIALSNPPATQVDVITELSDSYGHQQGKECPPLVVADPQPCDGFFVLVPRPAWLTCSQRVVVVLDLTGLGGPVFPEYVWSPVEYTDLQRFAEPYGRFWEVFTRGDTAPVAPQTRQQVTCGQTFQFRPSGCPPQWQPDIESALATRRAGHGV